MTRDCGHTTSYKGAHYGHMPGKGRSCKDRPHLRTGLQSTESSTQTCQE
ncbi:unnamed protein product, partial [Staurois parvus]